MSQFVKLTDAFRQTPEWVNLDRVKTITRRPAVDNDYQGKAPEWTELWFGRWGDDKEYSCVVETPEQIQALSGAEPPCPDPPGECGYYTHYLAYGGPDLTHAGFHAAVTIHERHSIACKIYESGRDCSVCTSGERRVRA
jgi:hypothetical protein